VSVLILVAPKAQDWLNEPIPKLGSVFLLVVMTDMFYGRIGRRLILSFVTLVVVVVGFFYNLIYRQLDQQLDEHLVAVAQLIAEKFDGDVVLRLRPEYEIYRRLRLQFYGRCRCSNTP
jgi:hypothetical protein